MGPDPKMLIICPNCQARYEVASQTIGNNGRKVQCASCHKNWKAVAEAEPSEADKIFSAEDEQALDADFYKEEQAQSKKTGAMDKVRGGAGADQDAQQELTKQAEKRLAMKKRQHLLIRSLPRARMQRLVVMVTSVLLMVFFGGGLVLRERIVMALPDLAGIYSAVGLSVNVVGLEFREVNTVKSLRDGSVVMSVSAMLENVSGGQVSVPPILVSLLDEHGSVLYEWSVTSQVVAMGYGEWVEFETELISPPEGAVGIRLSFVNQLHLDGNF